MGFSLVALTSLYLEINSDLNIFQYVSKNMLPISVLTPDVVVFILQ